jgi:hypothetical protein
LGSIEGLCFGIKDELSSLISNISGNIVCEKHSRWREDKSNNGAKDNNTSKFVHRKSPN